MGVMDDDEGLGVDVVDELFQVGDLVVAVGDDDGRTGVVEAVEEDILVMGTLLLYFRRIIANFKTFFTRPTGSPRPVIAGSSKSRRDFGLFLPEPLPHQFEHSFRIADGLGAPGPGQRKMRRDQTFLGKKTLIGRRMPMSKKLIPIT